mmetsp:Transcript_30861/g.70555  ORF Transcript_30861/g.70555 Transcript_30861/m.70555 type:complete len:217 (+) Transcript_30861:355-1005(+)
MGSFLAFLIDTSVFAMPRRAFASDSTVMPPGPRFSPTELASTAAPSRFKLPDDLRLSSIQTAPQSRSSWLMGSARILAGRSLAIEDIAVATLRETISLTRSWNVAIVYGVTLSLCLVLVLSYSFLPEVKYGHVAQVERARGFKPPTSFIQDSWFEDNIETVGTVGVGSKQRRPRADRRPPIQTVPLFRCSLCVARCSPLRSAGSPVLPRSAVIQPW